MNQIIKGYLDKFVSDFQSYNDLQESECFEHFINYICIKRDFLSDFDLDAIHIGGNLDNGIDGIAVIVNNDLVDNLDSTKDICKKQIDTDFIFTQSKTSNKLEVGEILKFLEGVYSLFESSNECKNDRIKDFIEIKNYLYSQSSNFKRSPNIYLKYAYNCTKDNMQDINQHIKNYENRFKKLSLFNEISIEILDSNDIQDIYKEISLNIKKEITLKDLATIPTIQGVQESYIGIIPLKELLKLILDNNNRIIKNLFYSNVRDFQGDTKINKEIIKTLQNPQELKHFGLYHNGITIIAKTLKKTGSEIALENFQIVNGCQTSHIIAENRALLDDIDSNMFIPIKLIATNDNAIINAVIKTTNTHNEVKKEAFESLGGFHKKLEEFYLAKDVTPKIYYERRSKQYLYDDKIKQYNIITLAEQIRTYLSMFMEIPHSVHRYYGELLESYRKQFYLFMPIDKNEYFEVYHIAGLSIVKLNEFIAKRKKKRMFRYHILFIFNLITINLTKLPTKNYNEQCKKIYQILSDDRELYKYFDKCFSLLDEALQNHTEQYRLLKNKKVFTDTIKNICQKQQKYILKKGV